MNAHTTHKTKITILRIFTPEEVLGTAPPVTATFGNDSCPVFSTDSEFLIEGDWPSLPRGFCEGAWSSIKEYVQTIHAGGNFPMWLEEPGTAVVSCPDGCRPVIFKIERTR
jgi:uncharacterized repeat protein (TIGR04076 family)